MKAGNLRDRITIQKYGKTQDPDTLEITTEWTDYLSNIPADVQFLSSGERIAAGAVQNPTKARIIIRYRRDEIDATMRIIYGNQVYEITGYFPDNENHKKHITIMVTTGLKQ